MLNLRVLLASAALVIFTTACSVDGNITDMTVRKTKSSASVLTGLVPGATVQTTAGGYVVQATVGEVYGSIQQTTSGGYTVYSNISGNTVSEGTYTTME